MEYVAKYEVWGRKEIGKGQRQRLASGLLTEPEARRDPYLLRDVTTILIDCGRRPSSKRGARWPKGKGCSRRRPGAAASRSPP